jgi:hypothetical protein
LKREKQKGKGLRQKAQRQKAVKMKIEHPTLVSAQP